MIKIIQILKRYAIENASNIAVAFSDDGQNIHDEISYSDLYQRLVVVGESLIAKGLVGQRVLIAEQQTSKYLIAFLACLYAGCIAVPVPSIWRGRWHDLIKGMTHDCQPKLVISSNESNVLLGIETIPTNRLLADKSKIMSTESSPSADIAYLQYTSGSTSNPKGVVITPDALMANIEMIIHSMKLQASDIYLSWLPPYHDMGLVGGLLVPLVVCAKLISMPTIATLTRPQKWLEAISNFDVTVSGGPAFAYRNLERQVTESGAVKIELKKWRLAYVGAETVDYELIEKFSEKFQQLGFRKESFYPCYGLAETVLFSTGANLNELIKSKKETHLISSGFVAQGAETIIVDTDNKVICSEGEIGEIWISGPHVAQMYWGVSAEKNNKLHAEVPGNEKKYLQTGDEGWIENGQIFVKGRLENAIVFRGSNFHAEDIEFCLKKNIKKIVDVIALQLLNTDRKTVLIIELIENTHIRELIEQIEKYLIKDGFFKPNTIYAMRRGGILRTTSGKPKRTACKLAIEEKKWPNKKYLISQVNLNNQGIYEYS